MARTVRNYLTTIRTAINTAIEAEILDASPIRGRWTLPRVDPVERHPLTLAGLDEVRGIFADVPIVQWVCLTGNRPSDARTLRFCDVDAGSATVDRGSRKSRAIRKYEICRAAVAVVQEQAQREHAETDVVFVNGDGRPWTQDLLYKAFRRRLVSVEYHRELNMRDLRHSFGTIMANEIGVPLPELQVLMGHTDIKTTMKYVRARGARRWLDDWDARQGG